MRLLARGRRLDEDLRVRDTLPAAGRDGLSSQEAAERLARDGPNRLPPPRRPHPLRQLDDRPAPLLPPLPWVAGALAFVADLPELGIAIFAVIVVNALFAFAQETRADRAAERLRDLLPRRITVRRDGRRIEIDATEVVTGDLLALGQGDRVPADAVVTVAHGLLVDTSLLTGESEATAAGPGDEVLAGMFVVEGEADATVRAIGAATRLAGIARLTTVTAKPVTPLAHELHRVVRTVATIAVAVGGAFFGLALVLGNDPADGFVFAIGVTVALVPEALLPTVTLSLAWGAERMAGRQVLVRDLEAVETLGSTTFICTDKTGTLTRNQMAVVEAWTPAGGARISGTGYEPPATVTLPDPAARPPLAPLALAGPPEGLRMPGASCRPRGVRSGGFRSVVIFRAGDKAFFVYGFPKSARGNIHQDELRGFRQLADAMLGYDDRMLAKALDSGALQEVRTHAQDLPE